VITERWWREQGSAQADGFIGSTTDAMTDKIARESASSALSAR
jgi:hypothetical protein